MGTRREFTLWAWSCSSSQAIVTSKNSFSSLIYDQRQQNTQKNCKDIRKDRHLQLSLQINPSCHVTQLFISSPDVPKSWADVPLKVVPSKAELLRVGHCETFYSIWTWFSHIVVGRSSVLECFLQTLIWHCLELLKNAWGCLLFLPLACEIVQKNKIGGTKIWTYSGLLSGENGGSGNAAGGGVASP